MGRVGLEKERVVEIKEEMCMFTQQLELLPGSREQDVLLAGAS